MEHSKTRVTQDKKPTPKIRPHKRSWSKWTAEDIDYLTKSMDAGVPAWKVAAYLKRTWNAVMVRYHNIVLDRVTSKDEVFKVARKHGIEDHALDYYYTYYKVNRGEGTTSIMSTTSHSKKTVYLDELPAHNLPSDNLLVSDSPIDHQAVELPMPMKTSKYY